MYYNREQLVAAWQQYDENYLENPENFGEVEGTEESAARSVDYLLSLVPEKHERVFSETEISHLQSKVHAIVGNGEVMMLFNEMLGIVAG